MTVPVEQRREWIKNRRQRRKSARVARYRRQVVRYILLCTIMVAGWSGFSKLPWSLHNVNQDIIVRGNQVATVDQIRDAIKNVGHTPLYRLNPRLLEKRVVALQAVKHAFVRRYAFPHPRIVVEVLEEFPWATYAPSPDDPPTCVIAQSGRMIPIKDFPSVTQPSLVIYGNANLKMSSNDVAQWAKWVAFISEQTQQPVEFVDLRKPFDIRVQNGDLYLKLGTADTSLTRRLGRLTSVLAAVQPMKGRLEYIDLGLDNNIPLKVAKKDIKDRTATASAGRSL